MRRSLKHIAVITVIAMMASLIPAMAFGASAPAKASISSVKQVTSTSAKVTWKSVTGAKGYSLYRATSKSGT